MNSGVSKVSLCLEISGIVDKKYHCWVLIGQIEDGPLPPLPPDPPVENSWPLNFLILEYFYFSLDTSLIIKNGIIIWALWGEISCDFLSILNIHLKWFHSFLLPHDHSLWKYLVKIKLDDVTNNLYLRRTYLWSKQVKDT